MSIKFLEIFSYFLVEEVKPSPDMQIIILLLIMKKKYTFLEKLQMNGGIYNFL